MSCPFRLEASIPERWTRASLLNVTNVEVYAMTTAKTSA